MLSNNTFNVRNLNAYGEILSFSTYFFSKVVCGYADIRRGSYITVWLDFNSYIISCVWPVKNTIYCQSYRSFYEITTGYHRHTYMKADNSRFRLESWMKTLTASG